MFGSSTYGMPSHGYPYNYTTTPLNSPPLGAGAGMHGFWGPDYSHTPAPTPQPQSPYASSGRSRSSQHRRRSDQLPGREGVPSFPATPQPSRGSATPAGSFSPYNYSTPSPRPSSFGPAAPSPGGDYYYTMSPQGPIPTAPTGYASPLPSDYEYVSSRPRASPRVRSSPFKSQAQSLQRSSSRIDSAYGGDDEDDISSSSSPYLYPNISFVDENQKPSRSSPSNIKHVSSKPSPRPAFEPDSPNVEFKLNVEQHFTDEAYYDYEELDTNHDRLYASYQQTVPSSPSMHPPPRERTRSRNSKTRTPGPGSDHPHSPPPSAEDIRNHTPPSRDAAAAHGIPQGYSTKNWDQQERPIMLLGSVFDANSLGKWIYDWTVFRHGTNSQVTEQAGELWLLLIQLSGKSKRAREVVENNRIKRRENLVLVNEFLESGDRLWDRMKRLLKHCEEYMWRAAQPVQGSEASAIRKGSPGVTMGKQSGKEFVDAMFGKERELERTEKLMTGMKLWSTRFDANCEEILRRPHA
ncbi:hypothetical protein TWF173_008960 [Orbilia oligospora]|uniref:Vegetative cell wall protein gp1 n=2 Tax=Orbilia oligospora TaxID=2813651 RepID=G1XV06_ARTOA|nr:hypothetical protein AOL_s00215g814 [Orbilia oligospora ATCC 24927]EGX43028.1 hypothetical protein AOL_s00215g814 [Orbilia oligospora ATCC 24927]KAF3283755.1 hypothetical protein TWF970_000928 [Orbilia oligospora]KAF3283756.1 hypothetical protein TWF970_000928 [Orbilia oligospora]KAF3318225.1 hypothetical protein TWF173_008960 [Orbilia oligospora]